MEHRGQNVGVTVKVQIPPLLPLVFQLFIWQLSISSVSVCPEQTGSRPSGSHQSAVMGSVELGDCGPNAQSLSQEVHVSVKNTAKTASPCTQSNPG